MWQDKLKSQGPCPRSGGEKKERRLSSQKNQTRPRKEYLCYMEVNVKYAKFAFVFTPARRYLNDLPLHSAETLSRLRLNLEGVFNYKNKQVAISIENMRASFLE